MIIEAVTTKWETTIYAKVVLAEIRTRYLGVRVRFFNTRSNTQPGYLELRSSVRLAPAHQWLHCCCSWGIRHPGGRKCLGGGGPRCGGGPWW